MATYVLVNTVQVAKAVLKSGTIVDSVASDTTLISNAGGLLIPTATYAALVTAAEKVRKMWASGFDQQTCDAAMMTAYTRALDLARDTIGNTSQTYYGRVEYVNPLAAELISIVADVALSNVALTIASQPNVPCKLQVRITDADSSVSAGTCTIVGTNAAGEAVTQVIPITGGTRTVITDDAYARVTSITVAALAGHTGADKIGVGVGVALGLPIPAGATGVGVYKATVDYADEAVGTVDTTARTIAPTTAANGTHDYEFWYKYTLAHTHTIS
jgi:hypothetical protein